MSTEQLIGTWKLVDFSLTGADGKTVEDRARWTGGYLIYTADGYMSAGMSFPDDDGKPDAMFYCGPFDALDDRNIHHIEISNRADLIGTDQVRLRRLEGGRLILTASPSIAGGPGSTADIVWERA